MEIYAIKKDFYIMITKPIYYHSICLLFCAAACLLFVGSCYATTPTPDEEAVASKNQESRTSAIQANFRKALLAKGYSVDSPENIEKPDVVDNLVRVKSLFDDKDTIFFSYSTLNRFAIYKGKHQIRARLYCFQFKSNEAAFAWFDVIDKSKSKGNRRLVVFSKPKKLLALAGDKVFLLEGYHIANFDTLYFIIDQLENVQYILSPTETKKADKHDAAHDS